MESGTGYLRLDTALSPILRSGVIDGEGNHLVFWNESDGARTSSISSKIWLSGMVELLACEVLLKYVLNLTRDLPTNFLETFATHRILPAKLYS